MGLSLLRYRQFLITLLFIPLALVPIRSQAEPSQPLPTVQAVDLERYSGRWFEISRLPMWFERKCIDNITANYTVRSDGHIDVLNSCRTVDGQISARGIAEVPDARYPGQLRVRFAPDWLAWLPVVWGDYWIMDLDPNYGWVMIGAPSRGYLWILSRTPQLDATIVSRLKQSASAQGFDIAPMIDVVNRADAPAASVH